MRPDGGLPRTARLSPNLFCALALAARAALAQQEQGPPSQAETSPPPSVRSAAAPPPTSPTVSFRPGSAYTFPADVTGSSGRMATTAVAGRVTVAVPVGDRLLLSFPVDGVARFYDFTGDPQMLPEGGAPWGTVRFFSIGVQMRYLFDQHWAMLLGVNGLSAGARGASFDKTLSGGATVGFAYAFSRKLILGLAVAAQTRPAADVFVLPAPIVEWELPFDEGRWRLIAGAVQLGPGDAGVSLTYSPVPEFSVIAGLTTAGLLRDFRLSSSGAHPNSVGRDSAWPLVLGAVWKPARQLRLDAYGGVTLFRAITVLDQNGNTISERDVVPAPIVGGAITLTL